MVDGTDVVRRSVVVVVVVGTVVVVVVVVVIIIAVCSMMRRMLCVRVERNNTGSTAGIAALLLLPLGDTIVDCGSDSDWTMSWTVSSTH